MEITEFTNHPQVFQILRSLVDEGIKQKQTRAAIKVPVS